MPSESEAGAINPSASPGAELRSARQKAGIEVAEVAKKLFISPAYVEGLETNDYSVLPETTFIRGYIRSYARMLGEDAERLVKAFDQLVKSSKPVEETGEEAEQDSAPAIKPVRPEIALSPLQMGMIALLLLVIAVFFLLPGGEEEEPADSSMLELDAIEVDVIDGSVEEAGAPTDVLENSESLEVSGIEIAPEADDEGEVLQEPADTLEVMFKEDCWLEVVDDRGEQVFADLGRAEQIINLEGVAPMRVKIGNPAAVIMSFNNELVDLDGYPAGKVTRVTLE